MAKHRLRQTLRHIRRALDPPGGGGLTDGQLLERFVAGRDEAAFEALVQRHGGMVLSVCRRVLGDAHEAEDAFQGTFLILARKAASVVKRDSVGGWLYAVAYHIALEARAALARRRARERQVEVMPHPEVMPAEPQDWRPVLDRELARLPEKYRAPVVLYHLEGRSHREVARQLGLPEGTLAGRLAKARRLLGVRLRRAGVGLPAGALAAVLSEGTAAAAPPALVSSTVRAAALVAAGEAAALATPAAALMKGALQTMLFQRMKLVAATVVVVLALGAGGLAWRAGGTAVAADKPQAGKPRTEVEALRREVELLRLNLEVVLEKVRAQEETIRTLRGQGGAKMTPAAPGQQGPPMGFSGRQPSNAFWGGQGFGGGRPPAGMMGAQPGAGLGSGQPGNFGGMRPGGGFQGFPPGPGMPSAQPSGGAGGKGAAAVSPDPDAVRQAEDALNALRGARDAEGRQRAADALEQALKKLRGQGKLGGGADAVPHRR